MKKAVAAVLVLFVALLCVVLVRAALFTSKQVKVEPAAPFAIDVTKVVKNFSEAVTFKTVSYQDPAKFDKKEFLSFHGFLEKAYPRVHASLKKEVVNKYSLLYTWKGTDEKLKPIILMGHFDVVPIEPGTEKSWTRPPFSGVVADGYIWGRGTLDNKVSVLGSLEAVEYLLSKGYRSARTVYLAFGHDEEIGGREGAKKITALLESRGVKAEYVIDEGSIVEGVIKGVDAPVALVTIAEKGYLSVEFSVESEGGHSSMPPKQTAAGIICAAMSTLEKNQFPERLSDVPRTFFEYLGPEMPFGNRVALANLWLFSGLLKSQLSKSPPMAAALHTTIAPTMLQGSVKENLLPIRATAVVNFRILPGDTIKSVLAHCEKVIDDPRVRMKTLGWADDPSPVSDINSTSYLNLQKTIRQMFPTVVVTPFLGLGATDARHYTGVSENIFRFCPVWYKGDDIKRAHGTNERIAVSNYENVVKFFIQLVKNSSL